MDTRTIVITSGIFTCIVACGPSDADFTAFSSYRAPDGTQTVVADSAHSVLAYGPETVRFFVVGENSQERKHVLTTKISNDGTGITADNIRAEWVQPDVLRLCLTGVEQEGRVLEIDVQALSYVEEEQEC